MIRTKLESPAVMVEGHAVTENTEDGPMSRLYRYVGIEIAGVRYALNVGQGWSHEVAPMVAAINEMGTVNLAKWQVVEEYDREAMEAYELREENDDRWAWGAALIG